MKYLGTKMVRGHFHSLQQFPYLELVEPPVQAVRVFVSSNVKQEVGHP